MISNGEKIIEKHAGAIAVIGAATLFLTSLFFSRGGMLHPEAYTFIPHYLTTEGSLARIVFDPAHTDFGMYQARELSYFIDWIDCQFMAWSAVKGYPHFLSLSHFVFAAVTAGLLWRIGLSLSLARTARAVLILAYLSTPMILLGGDYFRSAKAGVALGIAASLWLYIPIISDTFQGNRGVRYAALFVALLLTGLFDRQGIFFLLLGFALQATRCLARPVAREFILLGMGLCTLAALQSYNVFLGPSLIERLNGYSPSNSFQSVVPCSWSQLRDHAPLLFMHGPALAFRYTGMILGALPWPLLAVSWGAGMIALTRRLWNSQRTRNIPLQLWPLWLGLALMTMTALMVKHIPSLLFSEFSLYYYPLPTAVVLSVTLAKTISIISDSRRPFLIYAVALITVFNLAQLPDHRRTQHAGYYSAAYELSPFCIDALRTAASDSVSGTERKSVLLAGLPQNLPDEAKPALLALLSLNSLPSEDESPASP